MRDSNLPGTTGIVAVFWATIYIYNAAGMRDKIKRSDRKRNIERERQRRSFKEAMGERDEER